MAQDMEQAANDDKLPEWEIVGPDEHDTICIRWKRPESDGIVVLPLGPADRAAAKLADALGRLDFGETLPDRGEPAA